MRAGVGSIPTAPCHHAGVASPSRLDPREILGVDPDADADTDAAAYRREVKRWHPDRSSEDEAADRMALVNAAYAELRVAAEASVGADAHRSRTGGASART